MSGIKEKMAAAGLNGDGTKLGQDICATCHKIMCVCGKASTCGECGEPDLHCRCDHGVIAIANSTIPDRGDAHDGDPEPAKGETKATALPLLYFNEIGPALDVADFVEGLLVDGAMSVIYGESGCGKTFFMLDLALHVAAGLPWRGREIEQRGVLYLALEGSHGIRNRVAAFKEAKKVNAIEIPFAVVPVALDLRTPNTDVVKVITSSKNAAERLGAPVRLVVVDTLSRAMAGGDENGPVDMGGFVSNIDLIRQHLKAHVAIVHHSGKDVARGARGHNSLRAATDTEIEVSRGRSAKTSVARVTKQRDLESAQEFAFELCSIDLGQNRRGKPVTSCVVREVDAPESDQSLTKTEQIALNALVELLQREGVTDFPESPPGVTSVSEAAWRESFYRTCKPNAAAGTKKTAYGRAIEGLIAAQKIAAQDDRVWVRANGTKRHK